MADDGARVRIECPDGQPAHTRVYVVQDDGAIVPIPNLVSVTWTLRAGELAVATLEIEAVEGDVVGVVKPRHSEP